MKVKDLQEKLANLDPQLEVICYSEDEEFLPTRHSFRIFDIMGVDDFNGEKNRGKDSIPSIKFGRTKHSRKYASITITTDF